MEKYLTKLEIKDLHEIYLKNYTGRPYLAMIQMPSTIDVPEEKEITAMLEELSQLKTEAGSFSDIKESLIEHELINGKIISETEEKDLGISEFQFENGVICRHRKMDYEKDQVYLELNIVGGKVQERENELGLTGMAGTVLNQASSKFMSYSEIRDWRIGKKFNLIVKPEFTEYIFQAVPPKKIYRIYWKCSTCI